jgi:hypothetical protein
VRKTRKTDKNQFSPKPHTTKKQLLKKLKESNFNFHNPEVPSSNLGLATSKPLNITYLRVFYLN